MTRRDPIVDEVRKHRAAIARKHGNNLDAIIAAFQREDAADASRATVSSPPRKRSPSPARGRRLARLGGPVSGCRRRPFAEVACPTAQWSSSLFARPASVS